MIKSMKLFSLQTSDFDLEFSFPPKNTGIAQNCPHFQLSSKRKRATIKGPLVLSNLVFPLFSCACEAAASSR